MTCPMDRVPLQSNCSCNCTSYSTPPQLQLRYTTLHPAVVVRWPLQPLQPLQKGQLQPPLGPPVDSLCHSVFTTTNLSYRFTILETSAAALCGTTGNDVLLDTSARQAITMNASAIQLQGCAMKHRKTNMMTTRLSQQCHIRSKSGPTRLLCGRCNSQTYKATGDMRLSSSSTPKLKRRVSTARTTPSLNKPKA